MSQANSKQSGRQKSVRAPLRAVTSLLAGVLAIGVSYDWGQGGNGSIIGTVTDQTGALIPSVKVSVRQTETNQPRQLPSTTTLSIS
jgi:hypothetical protein